MEHVINFKDMSTEKLLHILDTAEQIKRSPDRYADSLKGKKMYMLFEKTSTRTALSFGLGIEELGGIYFEQTWRDSNFMVGEVCDEVRYVGRNVDVIMARLKGNATLLEMAKWSTVPVINGCCNRYHPSQALADVMTVKELFGTYDVKMMYIGIRNNVLNSLADTLPRLGGKLWSMTPVINAPSTDEELMTSAAATGNFAELSPDMPREEFLSLVREMDVLYTDCWLDMEFFNDPAYAPVMEERMAKMMPYQINEEMLAGAHAVVMHDMPIHSGYEVSRETVEKNIDTILRQAENRRHAEKGLLYTMLGE
ncbi:MAG: ornithine carbamoyltransferase [Oscillospiraceae bacterium]|nr:ornithine carbamoyltransferase [Oscillospiraceae bacterium]